MPPKEATPLSNVGASASSSTTTAGSRSVAGASTGKAASWPPQPKIPVAALKRQAKAAKKNFSALDVQIAALIHEPALDPSDEKLTPAIKERLEWLAKGKGNGRKQPTNATIERVDKLKGAEKINAAKRNNVKGRIAPGTYKKQLRAWSLFYEFYQTMKQDGCDVGAPSEFKPEVISAFIWDLKQKMEYKHSTLVGVISSLIRFRYYETRKVASLELREAIKETLCSVRRLFPDIETRVPPMRLEQVKKLLYTLDNTKKHPMYAMLRCYLLTLYWTGQRNDSLVHIQLEHLKFDTARNKKRMTLHIVKDKVPLSHPRTLYIYEATDRRVCPVRAMLHYLKTRNVLPFDNDFEIWNAQNLQVLEQHKKEFLFLNSSQQQLTSCSFIDHHLAELSNQAGTERFSSRSGRRGFATDFIEFQMNSKGNLTKGSLERLANYVGWKPNSAHMLRYVDQISKAFDDIVEDIETGFEAMHNPQSTESTESKPANPPKQSKAPKAQSDAEEVDEDTMEEEEEEEDGSDTEDDDDEFEMDDDEGEEDLQYPESIEIDPEIINTNTTSEAEDEFTLLVCFAGKYSKLDLKAKRSPSAEVKEFIFSKVKKYFLYEGVSESAAMQKALPQVYHQIKHYSLEVRTIVELEMKSRAEIIKKSAGTHNKQLEHIGKLFMEFLYHNERDSLGTWLGTLRFNTAPAKANAERKPHAAFRGCRQIKIFETGVLKHEYPIGYSAEKRFKGSIFTLDIYEEPSKGSQADIEDFSEETKRVLSDSLVYAKVVNITNETHPTEACGPIKDLFDLLLKVGWPEKSTSQRSRFKSRDTFKIKAVTEYLRQQQAAQEEQAGQETEEQAREPTDLEDEAATASGDPELIEPEENPKDIQPLTTGEEEPAPSSASASEDPRFVLPDPDERPTDAVRTYKSITVLQLGEILQDARFLNGGVVFPAGYTVIRKMADKEGNHKNLSIRITENMKFMVRAGNEETTKDTLREATEAVFPEVKYPKLSTADLLALTYSAISSKIRELPGYATLNPFKDPSIKMLHELITRFGSAVMKGEAIEDDDIASKQIDLLQKLCSGKLSKEQAQRELSMYTKEFHSYTGVNKRNREAQETEETEEEPPAKRQRKMRSGKQKASRAESSESASPTKKSKKPNDNKDVQVADTENTSSVPSKQTVNKAKKKETRKKAKDGEESEMISPKKTKRAKK